MPDEITGDLTKKLKAAPSEIHKFDIVRTVIEGLNARGEMMLKQRREVLRSRILTRAGPLTNSKQKG